MTGYFLIADLLGFGSIVQNLSEESLSNRIETWVELIQGTATKLGVQHVQLISDTVFAATESSSEGLEKLIKFGSTLLNAGVPLSLPIRGAISHGEYSWGKLTYGKAVIRGHELEAAQDWIGIGCENALPHLTSAWGRDSLVCYPLPMKRGAIRLHPVVAWEVPEFQVLIRFLSSDGLIREGDALGWELGQKLTTHYTLACISDS